LCVHGKARIVNKTSVRSNQTCILNQSFGGHATISYLYLGPYNERPPLWSSGQSSWLQIQRSGFDSRCYHIFCEVVGLERGPLSLASTTEELLERKNNGSGLENRDYGRRGFAVLITQKLALTWPTSGGRSVGIVLSWTQATEFIFHITKWKYFQLAGLNIVALSQSLEFQQMSTYQW
jgi:hypothetical protein